MKRVVKSVAQMLVVAAVVATPGLALAYYVVPPTSLDVCNATYQTNLEICEQSYMCGGQADESGCLDACYFTANALNSSCEANAQVQSVPIYCDIHHTYTDYIHYTEWVSNGVNFVSDVDGDYYVVREFGPDNQECFSF